MGASRLRRGILSIVFGLTVAQGLLHPQEAAAQTTPPTSENDPETAASRDLESMRVYYSRYAQGGTVLSVVDSDRVLAADPQLSNPDILRTSLTSTAVMPADTALDSVAAEVDLLTNPYSSLGLSTARLIMAPMPQANITSTDGRPMCVVVAAQPDVQVFVPAGMTALQTARFINRHEFRHCISFSTQDLHDDDVELKPNEDGSINPIVFTMGAHKLAEETRADVLSLMDMIALDGEDTTVIRNIAQWRASRLANPNILDLTHYSTPALTALATQIEKMGVERFRAMDSAARDALGEKIVRDYSLTPGALAQITLHMFNLDQDSLESRIDINAGEKLIASAAIALIDARKGKGQPKATPVRLSNKQLKQLENWNIDEQLAQKATLPDGSMTRMSLLTARAEILDGLRADIAADPANPVHGARVLMTHQVTQILLRNLSQAPQPPAPLRQAAPSVGAPKP